MIFNEEIVAQIMVGVGILTIVVNIITEIAKAIHTFKSDKVLNCFVVIVSIVLTVLAAFAYFQINHLVITWYVVVAFVITGILVGYAAMFGFDKLIKKFKKDK